MSIFEKYYNQKGIEYGINSTRRRKILELVGNIQGKKVLDVGCATGYLGQAIKELGNEVIGIDVSSRAVEEAKKVLNQALVLDIQEDDLPFGENYFDVVILAETIEHLFWPEKTIEKIKRVLKKDGFIVISTPNFLILPNRIKMLLGQFRYTDSGFLDRGHIHFFTYRSLLEFLAKTGLAVVEENHVPYFRFPEFFARTWPNLCAFQLVIKVKSKNN